MSGQYNVENRVLWCCRQPSIMVMASTPIAGLSLNGAEYCMVQNEQHLLGQSLKDLLPTDGHRQGRCLPTWCWWCHQEREWLPPAQTIFHLEAPAQVNHFTYIQMDSDSEEFLCSKLRSSGRKFSILGVLTFVLGASRAIKEAAALPALFSSMKLIVELITRRVIMPMKSCQSGGWPCNANSNVAYIEFRIWRKLHAQNWQWVDSDGNRPSISGETVAQLQSGGAYPSVS